MRVGDFAVEVVAVRDGEVCETESGHVLARPGTVYAIRLRNLGPLRCVADVRIDGKPVTGRGLVIDAYAVVTLERPVDGAEAGRFTVIAEGNERVFGPDGGRDNDALGEIEVSFRRELPRGAHHGGRPSLDAPTIPFPFEPSPNEPFGPPHVPVPPARPMAPPEWTPPTFSAQGSRASFTSQQSNTSRAPDVVRVESRVEHEAPPRHAPSDLIERAAGTGLTGASTQEFVPIAIGPLEKEATVIRLRLVIGTDEAFNAPRPLPDVAELAPARPPARP